MTTQYVKVAKTNELTAGQLKVVTIGNNEVLIGNFNGKYFATVNWCPHFGGLLQFGKVDGEELECAMHGSRFNLRTGDVARDPAETGLPIYQVRVDGNDLLVQLS